MISTDSLAEEHEATFHILGLLYVHPLASISLYVRDVGWFMRHHYAFYSLLYSAGYVRVDPFDPAEAHLWRNPAGESVQVTWIT